MRFELGVFTLVIAAAIAAGVFMMRSKSEQAQPGPVEDLPQGHNPPPQDQPESIIDRPQAPILATGPRGIRNNNPGNIRKTLTAWQGLADQQTDPAFFQFISPVYGIRAMTRILETYRGSYGLNTIETIINRYAPPVENDTSAYAAHVAAAVSVDPSEVLTGFKWQAIRQGVITAMIRHENGMQPYSAETISQGIALA